MSASEVSEGTKRLLLSGLLAPVSKEIGGQDIIVRTPVKAACEECLISGVKYFFPVQLQGYTRGIATSYAAPLFHEFRTFIKMH